MKYDKHHIEKIIKALENGDGRVRAVAAAGISYETFMRWLREENEFYEFVKNAEEIGNNKIEDICKRRIIDDKSWQSGAWWLERTNPQQFANKQQLNIDGEMNVKLLNIDPIANTGNNSDK